MSPMLNIALRAARRAAHLICRAVGEVRRRDIYEKVANDFVTKTDQAAEAVILDVLRSAYPDHGILAEESGMLEGDAEWLWVVDPLDGTSNFIHGLPHFSVSIACLHEGRMEHAVVLDIMRGEEFTASRGQGTFCGNQRLRVSVCEGLRRALVATGTPAIAVSRIMPSSISPAWQSWPPRPQAFGAPVRQPWIWRGWRPDAWMPTGKSVSNHGILPPVHSWCRKQEG